MNQTVLMNLTWKPSGDQSALPSDRLKLKPLLKPESLEFSVITFSLPCNISYFRNLLKCADQRHQKGKNVSLKCESSMFV